MCLLDCIKRPRQPIQQFDRIGELCPPKISHQIMKVARHMVKSSTPGLCCPLAVSAKCWLMLWLNVNEGTAALGGRIAGFSPISSPFASSASNTRFRPKVGMNPWTMRSPRAIRSTQSRHCMHKHSASIANGQDGLLLSDWAGRLVKYYRCARFLVVWRSTALVNQAVTNDRHLIQFNPCLGMQFASVAADLHRVVRRKHLGSSAFYEYCEMTK